MRVFLAVACGERLTAELTTALNVLRRGPVGDLALRWTHPSTWHLTLQFLGDWPADRLDGLVTALAAAGDQPAFSSCPGSWGGFPDLDHPRVLFLHMEDDGQAARLAGRVRAIVNSTWPRGPQDKRPFRGHLTMARIRSRLSQYDINLLREIKLEGLPAVQVEGFHLVASELRSDGPRYRNLAFFGLRK